ncbi:metal-dependent hydrolase [Haloferax namakaokahaiae]|uniref:Metal-dependent hydrolase n=1 Tax=Haloferax namakaokahaiae TaxID=1748331 RepID=A0ABD5ZBP4_9EURY
MFPIGHLALGYLSAALVRTGRGHRLPDQWVLVAALLGSQLPDLIDKPLAYYDVLVSGRSLGHSLFFVLPVLTVVFFAGRRAGYGEYALAFVVGTLSHFLGDTYRLALAGDWESLTFLLWPVFPATVYPSDGIPPWIRVIDSIGQPQHHVEYALAALAFTLWMYGRYTRLQRGSRVQA